MQAFILLNMSAKFSTIHQLVSNIVHEVRRSGSVGFLVKTESYDSE